MKRENPPPSTHYHDDPGHTGLIEAWWRADLGVSSNFWSSIVGDYVVDGTGHLPAFTAQTAALNNQPSFSLNGTSQYFAGAPLLSELLRTSDSTIVTVATRAADGAFHTMFSSGDSGSGNNYIWWCIDSGNKLFYRRLEVANETDIGNANVLSAGGGFWAAASYDGVNSQLYLNGATDGSPAANSTEPAAGDQVAIGALHRSTTNNFYSGNIAEVIVYRKALNAKQLSEVGLYITDRYGSL